ncbi:unknown [Collinsella sp. CAG:289]|nr:unknown [Collinsella sp. CAG:289]
MTGGTVKDHSQICRCLDGATGVNALNPVSSSDTSR